MLPEIWLPTVTFTTGLSVPVAVTTWVIGPSVTVTVWYSGGFSPWNRTYHQATAPRATTNIRKSFFI